MQKKERQDLKEETMVPGSAAVLGLGYVGLPLAVEMARAGWRVLGIDIDPERVAALQSGRSYIGDVPAQQVEELAAAGRLQATTDFSGLAGVEVIVICVPTPLRKTREPDLTHVLAASGQVAKFLRPGQLVILESTTYPGATERVVRPELEKGGLQAGRDFALAFSPERVDPGNRRFGIRNTPKVVGGITPDCTRRAVAFYRTFVEEVVPVSSATVAEAVKLLENSFRAVNIALVNELAKEKGPYPLFPGSEW
ncbi:MAG: nucleotide sugar dehydrogenase, partial [Bacillota bacterium]|nr:nucleotide sugar dehydrogenase [Bacillota bacterium]